MNTKNNILATARPTELVLIADFMQIIFNDDKNQYYDSTKGLFIGLLLKYDTDWNWLMEVVEKIKKLDYTINMNYTSCVGYIVSNKNYNSIDNYIEVARVSHIPNKYASNPPTAQNPMFVNEFNSPIEALYNLVLRFIEWYNLNNKTDKSQLNK